MKVYLIFLLFYGADPYPYETDKLYFDSALACELNATKLQDGVQHLYGATNIVAVCSTDGDSPV